MPSISLTSLLHIARAGLRSQQTSIDVVANNFANINTIGYKRSRAEFHELLNERLGVPPEDSGRLSGQAAGAVLADNQRIFNQGLIQQSDNAWDLAIEGEGFFQLQMPDGSTAYTRDGSFRLDGEGQLTNINGYFFLPNITLPPDTEQTLINSDGTVMIQRRGETEPETIATISLARFVNNSGLEKIGENLFKPTDASGQPQLVQPGTQGYGQIVSHALEASNVELSNEVVDLISAQRAYSLMARAVETSDEMLSLANQLR
ncbi:MAG: flagellar basal-body rod protein FlgG [Anaerolineae bacterium]|nr:flagellar basal-body rod protein FlgG [Anaerolineae bacterium]